MDAYHAKGRNELFALLQADEARGLSEEEAKKRLIQYGKNSLDGSGKEPWFVTLVKQFVNPLILILFVAFLATVYLEEYIDALVIALALLVNTVIGFFQEDRARRAFDALVAGAIHKAVVLRGGVKKLTHASELVPGDIVFLESGDVVPADAYLLSASDVSVSEAHLTGESAPIEKHTGIVPEEKPIYERHNMLFMGSPMLNGTAVALVVRTGFLAEVGAIAASLKTYTSSATPIEKSIERLARFLSLIVLAVIALLVAAGFVNGTDISETLLLAVALAVSVVPEGLPAAVTAILAIGMERILKERGLVRNLLAAETLGSTTIILTDKTGTLTEAKMRVTDVATLTRAGNDVLSFDANQRDVLESAFKVSDAFIVGEEGSHIYGRPTEQAILSLALDAGIYESVTKKDRVDFLKFSSQRRYAAALYEEEGGRMLYASGAPETLLSCAASYVDGASQKKLTSDIRKEYEKILHTLTAEGKRVIAVVRVLHRGGSIHRGHNGEALEGCTFLGVLALADSVRKDVPSAIQEVANAGVRVVMVTGDTPQTAYAVARESGIAEEGARIVMGSELDTLTDEELYRALKETSVFARILPQQKKRLVDVLVAHGEVVGMTGDGVNDAPALQAASIGVAVGSGTEVAREASDLVLLDNSFSILVTAIREGRRIMDNLKKAVAHLITTSFHEVFLIGVAVLAGLPLPVLPVQILWVNIFEEGFLTFGFAFEPAEQGIMKRSPQSEHLKTILTSSVRRLILIAGIITGIFSTGLYLWLLSRGTPIEEIRTIMFVVLVLDAFFFAISLKRLHTPFWSGNLFNNRYLIFALGFSAAGITATLALEETRTLLSLVTPHFFDFAVLGVVALVNLATIEFAKKIAFPQPPPSVVKQ